MVTAAVVGLMAYVRLFLMPGQILPIAYGVPLLLCLWFDDLRLLWTMGFCFLAITFIKELFPADPGQSPQPWIGYGLVVLDLFIITSVLHVLIKARRVMNSSIATLQRANAELSAGEEEIARQNQALQAQTQELERQGEKLSIANRELSAREASLHHLLGLSRSLRADLDRDQIQQRICDAARTLLAGDGAAAVIERQGDGARVVSHQGFDSAGLVRDVLPYERTFMASLLSRGQSGFLEDAALHPELALPQGNGQAAIRSVLAAPLKIHGQFVGALEVYSFTPRAWNTTEVALIESLAEQASSSLEGVGLLSEIAQQRLRLQTILRTLPIGVAVVNGDGSHVQMNSAGMAILGVPEESELLPTHGLPWQVVGNGENETGNKSLILQALHGGEEIDGRELEVIGKGKERITLLVAASPVRGPDGDIRGAVATFTNITPMKVLQKELEERRREAEESNRRKTRFLAAVSHDIRTPANAINLLAELLRRATRNPSLANEIPQIAEELQSSATSLVNLVSDVLDVSRSDSGPVNFQNTRFALRDLLEEVRGQLEPVATAKGLKIRIEMQAHDPIFLDADRVKLGRVLTNLVNNAVKFTSYGDVRIRAVQQRNNAVAIDVIDSGIGIAAEHAGHIFDEFFQINNPERDRNKGAGLGLSISKRLVDAMGGTLTVRSMVGSGSTFTLTLPAMLDSHAQCHSGVRPPVVDPSVESGPALQGVRLLLVEDHDATRHSTAMLLTQEGAAVLEASDGISALRYLYEAQPQLLLLDMMLPDLDGRDILNAIARNRPRSLRGVLVLTGDLTEERTEEVMRLCVDGLIQKPIEVRKLLNACRKCLANKSVNAITSDQH